MPDTTLKKLGAQHKRIIQLHLEGKTNSFISIEMRMTMANIRNVMGSPLVQAEVARLRGLVEDITVKNIASTELSADMILKNNSSNAATVMTELLRDESPMIKHKAAADILDRTGFPKLIRTDSQILETRIVLSSKAVERIQSITSALELEPIFESSLVENVEIKEGDD